MQQAAMLWLTVIRYMSQWGGGEALIWNLIPFSRDTGGTVGRTGSARVEEGRWQGGGVVIGCHTENEGRVGVRPWQPGSRTEVVGRC